MVMFRDQNAGRIHSIRIDNSFFESLEEFKYLGTNLTNQNSIQEDNHSTLQSGNACCNSLKNLLSSSLLSKIIEIKIQRTEHVDAVRCCKFFSGLVSMSDILQITTGSIALTGTSPGYWPAV
jgi:hypothetical protein